MKKRICILNLILIILFNNYLSFSQDTIQLVNGKKLIVDVKEVSDNHKMIFYEQIKNNKSKYKMVDFSEVYMINYKLGTKLPIYKQDSIKGFNLSFYEVGKFIEGEQFAMKHYKAPWITVSGAAIGSVAPLVMPYLYGLASSTLYVGSMAILKPSKRKYENVYPELFRDKAFKSGFITQARKKRIMNSIYGSLIGIGVSGVATGIIWIAFKGK